MVGIVVDFVVVMVDALPVVIEVVAECWGMITRAVGPVVVGAVASVMGVDCVVIVV